MTDDIQLTPSWILTVDHPASHYGIPVLVHRATGEGYGPGEIYDFPASAGGMQPAAHFVARFGKQLTGEDRKAAQSFLAQWPQGPQLEGVRS
jgi:hypothetical protein